MKQRPRIAITCGEPAGIGPEISIRAAWQLRSSIDAILIGDAAFLAMTAAAIDPEIQLVAVSLQAVRYSGLPTFGALRVAVIDCPLEAPVVPGQLNSENGRSVLQTLDIAIEAAQQGWVDAIVTAPRMTNAWCTLVSISVRSVAREVTNPPVTRPALATPKLIDNC